MSDLHARVAAQLYAFLHAENDAGTASENATVILDMVAEAMTSPEAVEAGARRMLWAQSAGTVSEDYAWSAQFDDGRQEARNEARAAITAALTAAGIVKGEGNAT